MSHTDFEQLLNSINALSPEQMRQLNRDLETKLAATEKEPAGNGQGSPVAMHDATAELDKAAEHAMPLRARSPSTSQADATQAHKPIWERILERAAAIPEEEWDKLPVDGAEQHDHYIYGTPKRPPSP